ncbi:LamG-like jellyroll fold domain-containing protein [Aeoliella sp. SH292]|uniref:LamG-like jellyroll fold domain-containing protein n=1 Tax=Aeoliella sp. SH292 TaxID=3454464 RepID=UPI003F9E5CA3
MNIERVGSCVQRIGSTYCFALLVLVCITDGACEAALIRHWALDELSLPVDISGSAGEVVDSTGNSTGGRLFGAVAGADLTGVVGAPGPAGFGTAYDLTEATGITGVFTNSNDAIPATGDFSLQIVMKTTSAVNNSNIFSNNNAQAGRAGLQVNASGDLMWFHNGGAVLAPVLGADLFVADGQWHTVGIAREGARFDMFINGEIVSTGVSTGSFSTTQSWMIGRQRSFGGDFDGVIADVKIYDTYQIPVPEPSSVVLGCIATCGCIVASRRQLGRRDM